MKKVLALTFLTLFLVASIAMVSAGTVVSGRVYDNPNFQIANKIADANVTVTCSHEGSENSESTFL